MKNSHILVIHRFPVLFDILKENKSILNFNIKKVDDNELNNSSNLNNFVIISGKKKTKVWGQCRCNFFSRKLFSRRENVFGDGNNSFRKIRSHRCDQNHSKNC